MKNRSGAPNRLMSRFRFTEGIPCPMKEPIHISEIDVNMDGEAQFELPKELFEYQKVLNALKVKSEEEKENGV